MLIQSESDKALRNIGQWEAFRWDIVGMKGIRGLEADANKLDSRQL